jgi:hypothetical protein
MSRIINKKGEEMSRIINKKGEETSRTAVLEMK